MAIDEYIEDHPEEYRTVMVNGDLAYYADLQWRSLSDSDHKVLPDVTKWRYVDDQ